MRARVPLLNASGAIQELGLISALMNATLCVLTGQAHSHNYEVNANAGSVFVKKKMSGLCFSRRAFQFWLKSL